MPQSCRVVTLLELLDGHRGVDVTAQPDTPVHVLRQLATRRNRNINAWLGSVRRQIVASAKEWGIPLPNSNDDTLGSVIASLGFPMVRLAAEQGVQPPSFIPRWAGPVLSCDDARSAARVAFGDRANRRVARVLAESILGRRVDEPGRELMLMPLAMAMALPDGVSGDNIANVLSAQAARHAAHHWPSVDQLESTRRGFALIGVDAAPRFAIEGLASLDGPAQVFHLMAHMQYLMSVHLGPLPRRLPGLAELVSELGRGPALPVAVDRERDFAYPEEVLRLHGARSGAHSVWLPRSRGELRAWGAQLTNCMADYIGQVGAGRSVILGLRRHNRLVAGLELTADLRQVTQFVRDGNQRPWRAERDAMSDILGRLGVGGG